MKRYMKKPIPVEALQLRWDNWSEMCEFANVGKLSDGNPEGCYISENGVAVTTPTDIIGLAIPTLEGVMTASQGDYVIRGVRGELYSCKKDIFEETYEEYDADNSS